MMGSVGAFEHVSKIVTFKEPMKDNNYSVDLTCSSQVPYWAQANHYLAKNKTVNGFEIVLYNNSETKSGELLFNYIVMPYTE